MSISVRFFGFASLFLSLIFFSTTTPSAGDMECYGDTYFSEGCASMYLLVCPAGDFSPVSDACGGSGDFIRVSVRDGQDNGIPGIPVTDYWFLPCDSGQSLYLCPVSVSADSATNSEGETTISGQVAARGCVLSGGVCVVAQGNIICNWDCTPICLDMVIKSPDLNTDGVVDLSDFGVFGDAWGTSVGDSDYNACCDFNDDGAIGLSDFGYFGNHWQHGCQ